MLGDAAMSRAWKGLVGLGLFAFALGCNKPPSKLEGHWKGHASDGVPGPAQAQADAFAVGTAIIARDGQITIMTPGGKHGPASFRVEKEDETTVVIHTDPGALAETFTFDGAGGMVWKVDAERSMAFKRAASASP